MLNRSVLMGRLVADPELRNTQNGVSVVQFRLAVDRDYTPKGQEKQTDFINVAAWRGTAEFIAKHFEKGQLIALTGSIQTRSYTDSQGNKRSVTEVIADQAYFAGSKKESGNRASRESGADTVPAYESRLPAEALGDFEEIDTDDSELPF